MTWSPLACGIISGKYGNGVPESSRASLKVFPCTSRRESGGGYEGGRGGEETCTRADLRQPVPAGSCRARPWRGGVLWQAALSPEPRACQRSLCSWPSISQPFTLGRHRKFSSSGGSGKCPVTCLDSSWSSNPHSYLFLLKRHFIPLSKLMKENPFSI